MSEEMPTSSEEKAFEKARQEMASGKVLHQGALSGSVRISSSESSSVHGSSQGDNKGASESQTGAFILRSGEMVELPQGTQLSFAEVKLVVDEIRSRPRCRLLVFGCGHDSAFWEKVNEGGKTLFLENDSSWIKKCSPLLRKAAICQVTYTTLMSEAEEILDDPVRLKMDLPFSVRGKRWDVILVDGPLGYKEKEHHGRMQSIFMASRLAVSGGSVFVHDCERKIEAMYAQKYLGMNNIISKQVTGRALLRCYQIKEGTNLLRKAVTFLKSIYSHVDARRGWWKDAGTS